MTQSVRSRIRKMLYPPTMADSVPITVRNTYLVAWVLLVVVVPVLALFAIMSPRLASLIVPMDTVLALVAIVQIRLIHAGSSISAGPLLAVLGWAMLTWASWMTGGLYSPALYGQFVLVVLAVMCNGWRWSMLSLALAALALIGLAWAELAGVAPPRIIVIPPMLFAAIVASHLIMLVALTAILNDRMRAMNSDLGSQLIERRVAEQLLTDIIDNAPFGAFVCRLTGDRLLITHVNTFAGAVLGVDQDRLLGSPVEDVFPGTETDGLVVRFHQIAENGGTHDVGALACIISGRERVLDVHVFQMDSGSVGAFFTDVTDRRIAEAEINEMAFHDALTELPNRQMLEGRLASAITSAHSNGKQVAMLFIDLDDFKSINDVHGHHAGDELLSAVAQRLRGCSRPTDTVARLGGDEFAMIIADLRNPAQAEAVARKVVVALHEPFTIGGRRMVVTASVGVTMAVGQDLTLTTLLERSDAAMYLAKQAGRDGYVFHRSDAA